MGEIALTVKQQELIEEVRKITELIGRTPTLAELDKNSEWPTQRKIYWHFGNYTELLKAAGLPMPRCTKRYGIKELQQKLTAYILTLGRVPTLAEVHDDPKMPAGETYLNVYGYWEAAVEAAGFTMSWCSPQMCEKLIRDLQRKYVELGYKLPSPQDVQNDLNMEKVWVYVQVFGSMKCAQKAARIYDDFCERQRKEIIETLRQLYRELGRVPTTRDPGVPNDKVIGKVFGSFNKALRAAGFEVNHQAYSRKMLIDQLQRKARELGRSPTAQDIENDPRMASMQTFRRFFGSHDKALKAAKLPPAPGQRGRAYTQEELISQLKRKGRELGRTPTTREINADPKMANTHVFQRVFGSYKKALEAAGVMPARLHPKHTREDLILQLRRKTAELGRVPMQIEIETDPSMAAANTFTREFGSLNKAIIAAGFKPQRKKEYSDSELLEALKQKYIDLGYLENGHRPTNREINADPEMASTKTYDLHFGSTNKARELVERMIAQNKSAGDVCLEIAATPLSL